MSKALSLFEPTLFRPFHNMLNDWWDSSISLRPQELIGFVDDRSNKTHTCRFNVGTAKPDDITVEVKGGRLCVTAKAEQQETADGYSYSEFFERSWSCDVPRGAAGDPEATLKDGRLTVQFPVATVSDVKKIEVKKS